MPLNDLRSVHMPYCLQKQEDGRYIVLNRAGKPLGFCTNDKVKYDVYPIKVKMRITSATAKKLSWEGNGNTERIFLYNDGCIPTKSSTNMTHYLDRLRILMSLKISSME